MLRFGAFQHRNFRRYFIGQVISNVGTWLQALALTWLVLDRTGRSDRLGLVVALQFLPLLVLGAPAGVLAEPMDVDHGGLGHPCRLPPGGVQNGAIGRVHIKAR